jgi:hypothetical protein
MLQPSVPDWTKLLSVDHPNVDAPVSPVRPDFDDAASVVHFQGESSISRENLPLFKQ